MPGGDARLRPAGIFRHQRESKRTKVTGETEDVFDILLVRENTSRVVYKRELLTVVVFELASGSVEDSSPDRKDVDTLRGLNGVQDMGRVSVAEFVESKCRKFRENCV
jgi:hypothetical protein